jgi:hypothetical protein
MRPQYTYPIFSSIHCFQWNPRLAIVNQHALRPVVQIHNAHHIFRKSRKIQMLIPASQFVCPFRIRLIPNTRYLHGNHQVKSIIHTVGISTPIPTPIAIIFERFKPPCVSSSSLHGESVLDPRVLVAVSLVPILVLGFARDMVVVLRNAQVNDEVQ